ncbi:hypothetical protein F9288_13785 [Sphingomonas sp. CL5.1]|uniref:helix-turn-helix transcriptional regulator n=1 Tax=Sphingomonas sp. CL5.1 TaxID=2653203 RepID=UPI001582FDEA|nr:LuxR C-terminal-related transcriptional regulator [Sphingomonas sp. CL5.1]QKS00572.1 hypothetical protein F9288_13785 [Sphingomonas sp. CL5.1]
MVMTMLADPTRARENARLMSADLGGLVGALGTPRFADELLRFLREVSNVEYVHFFKMIGNQPSVLRSVSLDASGSAERQADFYISRRLFGVDPWVADWIETRPEAAALFHVTRAGTRCMEMRNYYDAMQVSDRVMVCGSSEEGILGISLAKSQQQGGFPESRERLEILRDLALPLFIKHREYGGQRNRLTRELLDVAQIERRIERAPERLPRREVEVGARILRGLTASGIALDLGIGRETVICYRKRLYEKLALGSYHDLLSWYMSCCADEDGETIN